MDNLIKYKILSHANKKFLQGSTTLMSALTLLHFNQFNIFNKTFFIDDEIVPILIGKITCTKFRNLMFKYLNGQPALLKHFVKTNFTLLKSLNLYLYNGAFTELLPGITAVKVEGHTPGQIALTIHSDKEHLLYISDAYLHCFNIERLDWQTNYDWDHEKAKQSRIKFLELA